MAEDSHITTKKNSKLGKIFLSFVDTIEGFYDPSILALVKQVASSSPSPTDIEVAYGLLGAWFSTGLTLPKPIPPAPALHFPADHGEHWDVPIEWHYITLSLNLECGGRVSAVFIIFRKAIATRWKVLDIVRVLGLRILWRVRPDARCGCAHPFSMTMWTDV